MKAKLRSFFKFPNRKTGFILKVNVCLCIHVFSIIVILKGTLVITCLASHLDIIESWRLIVGKRAIYYAKNILNPFVSVEVRILVETWNIYEAHIFRKPLLQTCRFETTSLCLNYRLRINTKFVNFHYFYWH